MCVAVLKSLFARVPDLLAFNVQSTIRTTQLCVSMVHTLLNTAVQNVRLAIQTVYCSKMLSIASPTTIVQFHRYQSVQLQARSLRLLPRLLQPPGPPQAPHVGHLFLPGVHAPLLRSPSARTPALPAPYALSNNRNTQLCVMVAVFVADAPLTNARLIQIFQSVPTTPGDNTALLLTIVRYLLDRSFQRPRQPQVRLLNVLVPQTLRKVPYLVPVHANVNTVEAIKPTAMQLYTKVLPVFKVALHHTIKVAHWRMPCTATATRNAGSTRVRPIQGHSDREMMQ